MMAGHEAGIPSPHEADLFSEVSFMQPCGTLQRSGFLWNRMRRGLRPYCGENNEPGKYRVGGLTFNPELENSQDPKRTLSRDSSPVSPPVIEAQLSGARFQLVRDILHPVPARDAFLGSAPK